MGPDKNFPCYKCDMHTETCHSTCEYYKKFRKRIDCKNASVRQKKDEENAFRSVRIRCMKGMKSKDDLR